ncbi:hypothetical protein P3X46_013565 [Hevea brasiliensis]|uniref:Anthocyanidin 3-O-glucosyltransferase n=1 Tax=Hevea brasiliensis TaxID=3981 RepID=A0ABQ9M616_HEVBR|nr:hypothetical protein P3X46_013565 [Hevea brasiliensis]
MLPFLELSKQLVAKGVEVLFISTPRNIQRLPSISPDLRGNLKLVAFPLPFVNGLPENCEATIDLQLKQVQYLKKAYDMLQMPMENLMQIAAKCGVLFFYFSTLPAVTLSFFDLMVAPNWFPFPSLLAHRPDQAAMMIRNVNIPDKSGKTSGQRWAGSLEGYDFVSIRSCPDFEEAYLNPLQEMYQKTVIPVGLVPPNLIESETNNSPDSNWSSSFKWLDQQEPKFVVFVAFGSEYKMPTDQIQELAFGLELSDSEQPFSMDYSLPNGFLARTSSRGIVSLGWAPHRRILAHPAIGLCILHCGWSSTIETFGFGQPSIPMSMMTDQDLNAKLLIEQGVGFEVPRNEDGSFNGCAVAKSIKVVMVWKEGEPSLMAQRKMVCRM